MQDTSNIYLINSVNVYFLAHIFTNLKKVPIQKFLTAIRTQKRRSLRWNEKGTLKYQLWYNFVVAESENVFWRVELRERTLKDFKRSLRNFDPLD